MKNAICAVLLVCSVAVVAEEPKQPETPATEAAPVVPPAIGQPTLPWMLEELPKSQIGELLERRRQGPGLSGQLSSSPRQEPGLVVPRSPPPSPCYFIRTLRPVLPEGDAQRSGFIPLQARVLGTVQEPVCTNGGLMRPLIPVRRLLLKNGD